VDVDKHLKHRADQIQAAKDFLKIRTLGLHVASLIARDGEISVSTLTASLKEESINPAVNQTDQGLAEAALSYLQELTARRG
jgi:hypothetical protein